MSLREAVLVILLGLPPHHTDRDEPDPDRIGRLGRVAGAIADAAGSTFRKGDPKGRIPPLQVAAALLTLGWAESRWARYVGEGRCSDGPRGARCDPDRHGRPQARGYWQLHRAACPAIWLEPDGSSIVLRLGARCAARRWAGAWHMCRRSRAGCLLGSFAGYRGGRGPDPCDWRGAASMARRWTSYVGALRQGGRPVK